MSSFSFNGILAIDKPKGVTSHDVISSLRRLLNMSRIGHAGTLDPDATGLLTVCLGKATKVSGLLTQSDKTYLAGFRLGQETTTYDVAGETVAERPVHVDRFQMSAVLKRFLGEQEQKPPLYSAVKVGGKKLYEYARRGEPVVVPKRRVTVYSIRLLSYEPPCGELEIVCSKGTYVRSLVHDIGQRLETGGVATLIRRTESGPLHVKDALELDDIERAPDAAALVREHLVSIPLALAGLPRIRVTARVMPKVLQGAGLQKQEIDACRWDIPAVGPIDSVLMVGEEGEAVALGAYDGAARLRVKRVL